MPCPSTWLMSKLVWSCPKNFGSGTIQLDKYYVSKEVGEWGQKMAIFADLRTYHADVGGWVGPKKLKMG